MQSLSELDSSTFNKVVIQYAIGAGGDGLIRNLRSVPLAGGGGVDISDVTIFVIVGEAFDLVIVQVGNEG